MLCTDGTVPFALERYDTGGLRLFRRYECLVLLVRPSASFGEAFECTSSLLAGSSVSFYFGLLLVLGFSVR